MKLKPYGWQLDEEEKKLQIRLEGFPSDSTSNHELGIIKIKKGEILSGLKYLHLALEIDPVKKHHWTSFIKALVLAGLVNEAFDALRQGVARGLIGEDVDKLNDVINSIRKEISFEAKIKKINFDIVQKKYSSALNEIDSLLRLTKQLPSVLIAKAEILYFQNKFADAINTAVASINVNPYIASAYLVLAKSYEAKLSINDAIDAYQKYLELNPEDLSLHLIIGDLLNACGNFEKASEHFEKLIISEKHLEDAYLGNGMSKQGLQRYKEAIFWLEKVLQINSKRIGVHALIGVAYNSLGFDEKAEYYYRLALTLNKTDLIANSNLLFHLAYSSKINPNEYLKEAENWERRVCLPQDINFAKNKTFKRSKKCEKKLKIGYVSGDFREHAVSSFFKSILKNHNQAFCEIYLYSTNPFKDKITHQLKDFAHHWCEVWAMSDSEACNKIQKDEIDVLIDLSGHTAHNRLGIFAKRAAPVQAHYLGFFASTGLSEMDFWIADEALLPKELRGDFIEEIIELPRVWISYQPEYPFPKINRQNQNSKTITLGSFNNLNKIKNETIRLWSKILTKLPNAHLILKATEFKDQSNISMIYSEFESHGIDRCRVELRLPTKNWNEHMEMYNEIDIALDPIKSHAGVTTTCDALWMGVPLVTLAGNKLTERQGVSILNSIGRDEWIANTEDNYIEIVIKLTDVINSQMENREIQRQIMQRNALCDALNLTQNLENSYKKMYEKSSKIQWIC